MPTNRNNENCQDVFDKHFLFYFMDEGCTELANEIDLQKFSQDSGRRITDKIVQEICKTNPNITSIVLNQCHEITDESLFALGDCCCNLQNIFVRDCNSFTIIGLRSLALKCYQIHTMDFTNCFSLNDKALRIFAASLEHLEYLNLTCCRNVTDQGVSEVAHCCTRMKCLLLRNCSKIGEFGSKALKKIGKRCHALKEIDLHGCKFVSDSGVLALAKGCTLLRRIDISECSRVSEESLIKLGTSCKRIEDFTAARCPSISDICSHTIVKILSTQLARLDLSYCPSVGRETMKGVCECRNLQVLKVSGCLSMDDHAVEILAKGKLPRLSKLELKECIEITSQSITALVPQDGIGLSYLDITSCSHIGPSFLHEVSDSFIFSNVICDDSFLGFQPKAEELHLRQEAYNLYKRNLAALLIQRVVKGILVRKGEYLIRKREWVEHHKLPKIQAIIRGNEQRKLWKKEQMQAQKEVSAIKIEALWRGFMERRNFRRTLDYNKIQKQQYDLAILLQKLYHGHVSRVIVGNLKIQKELKQLNEAKIQAKLERAAKSIQRYARGLKGRRIVKEKRKNIELETFRYNKRNAAALKVQNLIRGWRARVQAHKIRAERRLYETQWLISKIIQATWRGMKGRMKSKALKIEREKQWRIESSLLIQRIWRGHTGRFRAKCLRSLASLRKREVRAAIFIQRIFQGIRGRKVAKEIRMEKQLAHKLNTASTNIQRLFRGYKGREKRFVAAALQSLKEKSDLLLNTIRSEKEKATKIQQSSHDFEQEIETHTKEINHLEKELAIIEQTKSKYVDSDLVTGAPQRCLKYLVQESIRKKLVETKTELASLSTKNDALKIEMRETQCNIKKAEKQLSSFQSMAISKAKTERIRMLQNQYFRQRLHRGIASGSL